MMSVATVAVITVVYATARYYGRNEQVRFADVALPWRWSNYERARGEAAILAARRFVAERKFAEAVSVARRGLDRSPASLPGRLLLAELYFGLRQPDMARRLLLEGLPYHGSNPEFLKPLLTYLLGRHEDALVVGQAQKLLDKVPAGSEAARLLASAAATASYSCGHYDVAEDFLKREPKLAASVTGRALAAKIEYERGYHELGLLQLRELAREHPREVEIQREVIERLRRRGLHDEARRAALSLQLAHPELVGPRIELLSAYRKSGDADRLAKEIDALLRDGSLDAGALLLLADFAANGGDIVLVERVREVAESRKFPSDAYGFLVAEAAIVARDYSRALAVIRELQQQGVHGADRQAVLSSLQAIAHCGLGETAYARVFLTSFLGAPELRADNLLAVANRLAELGAADLARQTLLRAVQFSPPNQAALMRLIEFDLVLDRVEDLSGHVQRYLKMRRPSLELLRVVQHKLGSDLFLYSKEAARTLELVREAVAAQSTVAQR